MSVTDQPTILLETSEIFKYKVGFLDADKTAKYEYDLAKSEVDHLLLQLQSLPQTPDVQKNTAKVEASIHAAQKRLVGKNPTTGSFIDAKDLLRNGLEDLKKFANEQSVSFVEARTEKDNENILARKFLEAKMRRESLIRILEDKQKKFLVDVGQDLLELITEANKFYKASLAKPTASESSWESAEQKAKENSEEALTKAERSISFIQAGIDQVQQARDAYNSAVKKMHKSEGTRLIFETMDTLLKDVEASLYFTMAEKNEIKTNLASVQLHAFKNPSPSEIDSIQGNLYIISTSFYENQTHRIEEQSQIIKTMNDLDERCKKALLYTEAKIMAPIGQGLREAKEKLGMWEIESTKSILDAVEKLLQNVEKDTDKQIKKEAWDTKLQSLITPPKDKKEPAIVSKLQLLMEAGKTNPALVGVSEKATALNMQYTSLVNESFFKPELFTEYLDEINDIETELAALEKSYTDINDIKLNLADSNTSKEEAIAKINAALSDLEKGIPKVLKPAKAQVRKPFEEQRDALNQSWTKTTHGGLNKDNVSILQGYLLELDVLEKNIRKEIESYNRAEDTLTPEFEIILGKQLQAEIKILKDKCDNITDELLMFGFQPMEKADKLAADASMVSIPAALEGIKKELEEHMAYLDGQLKLKTMNFQERKKKALKKYSTVDNLLTSLIVDVTTYESSWKFWQPSKKEFKKLAEVMQKDLKAIEPSINSDIDLVFSEGKEELDAIHVLVLRAQADFNGDEESPSNNDSSIVFVKTQLDELKKTIKADTILKARNAKIQDEFLNRVSELIEKLGDSVPKKLHGELIPVRQDYEKESRIAENETARFEPFTKRYDKTLELLSGEKSKAFENHEEYYAKLLGGFNQAKMTAKVHGMMDQAESLLQQYATELNMVLNDGAKLANLSNQTHEGIEKNKSMQAEWEAKIDAFNREEFQRLKDAVSAKQSTLESIGAFFWTPKQFSEVETLRDQAMDASKKGDYEMALFRLSDAKARAQFHLDFPEGSDGKQIADISAIKKIWRDAVDKYQADLGSVCSGIQSTLSDKGESDGALKVVSVQKQIETLFAKPVFDNCVQMVSNLNLDGATARKYVKEGLAEVRRLRELLNDGRIMQLHKHPFTGVDPFKGHYHIGKALTDIEKTLLMANGRD